MPPSTVDDSDALVRKLHDEAGASLRSVSTYDGDSYEMLYMRENVDAIYSETEIDDIFDDLRLEGWGRDTLEGLFNAGDLECSLYGFDDAMMFHFVTTDFAGALVTYDRGAGVDTEEFIRVCKREIGE